MSTFAHVAPNLSKVVASSSHLVFLLRLRRRLGGLDTRGSSAKRGGEGRMRAVQVQVQEKEEESKRLRAATNAPPTEGNSRVLQSPISRPSRK